MAVPPGTAIKGGQIIAKTRKDFGFSWQTSTKTKDKKTKSGEVH
ncbi:MAG: hypothetical protein QM498_00130 [Desulfobacterium sp.]